MVIRDESRVVKSTTTLPRLAFAPKDTITNRKELPSSPSTVARTKNRWFNSNIYRGISKTLERESEHTIITPLSITATCGATESPKVAQLFCRLPLAALFLLASGYLPRRPAVELRYVREIHHTFSNFGDRMPLLFTHDAESHTNTNTSIFTWCI